MPEYPLISPGGKPEAFRVEVAGRVMLALGNVTLGYLGRRDAWKLAQELLDALRAKSPEA